MARHTAYINFVQSYSEEAHTSRARIDVPPRPPALFVAATREALAPFARDVKASGHRYRTYKRTISAGGVSFDVFVLITGGK